MKSELYNLTEQELEDFDKLYDGALTEEEYYVLKAKLQLDEILQHKFLVYKLMRREIEADSVSSKALKHRLVKLDKKSGIGRRVVIWSSLLFGLLLLGSLFFQRAQSESEVIYQKYVDSEAGLSISMDSKNTSEITHAMLKIANEDFTGALEHLKRLPANDTVLYFQGYCLERQGELRLAEKTYYDLASSTSEFINQKSTFRQALLLVKLGDSKAESQMKRIAADSSHLYNKLAQQILLDLSE